MIIGKKQSTFGVAGLVTGAFALVMALLPIWVLPILIPPKPIEQVVVDSAQDIKQRLIEKVTGKVSEKQQANKVNWYSVCAVIAITLGASTLILAAVGFARHESSRILVAAALLGVGAIVAQFLILVLAVVVFLVLVALVLPKVLESMQ